VIEGDDKCITDSALAGCENSNVKTTNMTRRTFYPTRGEEVTDPTQDGEKTMHRYRVLRVQADWTFTLQSEFPVKELRHLPKKKMPPRGTTY
jgi:hypothetical protein